MQNFSSSVSNFRTNSRHILLMVQNMESLGKCAAGPRRQQQVVDELYPIKGEDMCRARAALAAR